MSAVTLTVERTTEGPTVGWVFGERYKFSGWAYLPFEPADWMRVPFGCYGRRRDREAYAEVDGYARTLSGCERSARRRMRRLLKRYVQSQEPAVERVVSLADGKAMTSEQAALDRAALSYARGELDMAGLEAVVGSALARSAA